MLETLACLKTPLNDNLCIIQCIHYCRIFWSVNFHAVCPTPPCPALPCWKKLCPAHPWYLFIAAAHHNLKSSCHVGTNKAFTAIAHKNCSSGAVIPENPKFCEFSQGSGSTLPGIHHSLPPWPWWGEISSVYFGLTLSQSELILTKYFHLRVKSSYI